MAGDEEEEDVHEIRLMGRDIANKKASESSIPSTSSLDGSDEALARVEEEDILGFSGKLTQTISPLRTRASNSKLVELLPEPEHTLNRRLRRRNRRVPYAQRNNPPQHLRIVYPPILNINYFCYFLDILRNYNPMDDEPMWAVDRVVAPTPGFAITIPETVNEFAIKHTKNEDVRLMMFPLSLTGEANTWLDELNEGTIKMWDEL
ncbi:hypothetical protein Tco_1204697 [Tanacetum coccineum]